MSLWKPGDGTFLRDPVAADGFGKEDRDLDADVVIVGTGPGGAACARALAAAGAKVWLLEEGPAQSRFAPNHGHTMRYHMQEGGAMVGEGSVYIAIASGRGIGGGTLVNSAIAWRAPDHVLNEWSEKLGDDRYAPDAMRPVYDELWELLGIGTTRIEISGKNNDLVVRGVKALGIEGGYLDRATPRCVGCGVCYFGCPSGGKASMNLNLLVDAASDGARIQAETKVTEILVEGGRAVGVRGRMFHPDSGEPGGLVTVRAKKVVISAGGIGTPRLLHFSGIAETLGPAVGKGLHIHPGSAVMGVCDEPIELWKGATQGAWFKTDDLPGVLPHTFSAPPEACLSVMGAVGADAKRAMAELPYLCGMVVMISDTGEGSVGAHDDGRAKIRYEFAPKDIDRIRLGMFHVARVLLAGGARELIVPVYGVGRVRTAEELAAKLKDRAIADFTMYASHPMSTCRMGTDPATSVIRPDARTHAIDGLWLCDTSIFPTSLGVNPSITTMAMGTVIGRGIARAG